MILNRNSILKFISILTISSISLYLFGCSSGRYTSNRTEHSKEISSSSSATIRVFMDQSPENYTYIVKEPVILSKENSQIALVKTGNRLIFSLSGNKINLDIAGKNYSADYFSIKPAESKSFISFKDKEYRGALKFVSDGRKINIVNTVNLENYVKGVIPAEMPTGKGNAYFQALKAFAICVRTYAVDNIKGYGSTFDVYLDTRDQVYGGAGREKKISNLAAEETKNVILGYDGQPAVMYYHASCGGHTEKASNVFPVPDLPYLRGVKDGDPPNCSIAPKFSWEVTFSEKEFIKRLYEANLIPNEDYSLNKVEVANRFKSGRVDNLTIILNDKERFEKRLILKSNGIRSVLKPPGGGILRSTLFNIFTDEKNNVIIKGKGYGHGVGLCQWGALHLSEEGKNYKSILSFYFPGTELMELR